MPKFDLAPLPAGVDPEELKPTYPAPKPTALEKLRDNSPTARQEFIRRSEQGPLKPMAQLFNALASPDTKAGIITGPVNGISKLGNAIGDLVQGKPIDTKDAWVISDKTARQLNPWRNLGGYGQTVLPADEAGLAIGEGIGAEVAGAVTGAALLNRLGQLGRLKNAADALKATQTVRRAAVAVQASPALKAGVNVARNVGQALVGTSLAAPFLDQEDGNLSNMGDLAGLKLPGRVEQDDNYLQALGKSLLVEGIATPLALIGAGSLIAPIRKGLAAGDTGWIKELADAELEPYLPRPMAGPALPPAQTIDGPALPSYTQQGGPIVPYDSAITRSLQEQTQIRQVSEQRQRLQDMGLLERGEGGQLELNVGQAIDPEIRLQIRQLQTQRGLTIKQMQASPDQIPDLEKQLADIEQQIGDLNLSGNSQDFMPGERFTQPELDMPDPRPELDTALAQLDELDDQKLREIHSRVYRGAGEDRNAQELTEAQGVVQGLNERIADIQARAEAGTVTPAGAKRMLTKVQKELVTAQQRVTVIEGRQRLPETLVGDQLELAVPQQLGLDMRPQVDDELTAVRAFQRQREQLQDLADQADEQLRQLREAKAEPESLKVAAAQQKQARTQLAELDASLAEARGQLSPEAQLRLTAERWRTREEAVSEFGYRTPDDYRSALQGWNRDQLRQLAMPDSSPEVAALVKARTGRRVWQAKKSDIIDALVEISERRGRYLPPEPAAIEQGALRLTTNAAGLDDAPLLDMPADLSAPGMTKVLDADGNEVVVPAVAYQPRGMDAATRDQLKAEILRRMIDNGEVQAPVTPLPQRPKTTFNQGEFVEELMADPTGQLSLLYASDELPAYKASGKNADALIEEMRLRFEYNALDAAAEQAQRDAYMAEKGWDNLGWEEKKQLGILGEGFYGLRGDELDSASDRFRRATPAARSDLDAPGGQVDRSPASYRGRLDENGNFVPVTEAADSGKQQAKTAGDTTPAGNTTAPADRAKKQPPDQAAAEARRANAAASRARERRKAAVKAEIDKLQKQAQGASC